MILGLLHYPKRLNLKILECFYSIGMILFQWNNSALKKKPYKRLNLKILEWFYSNRMISFHWNDFIPMEWFCIEEKTLLKTWFENFGIDFGMILFQSDDFIPLEWFYSNGMILHWRKNPLRDLIWKFWDDFIPIEWFYSIGMILFQWNNSALKKKPYKRLY